jgi:diaminopimelate decarboxylase
MPAILRHVHEAGLGAEAISGAEAEAAFAAGFSPDRLVLGGVAKAWPTGTVPGNLMALLDDTLDGFSASIRDNRSARYHCVRLRFPHVISRLGFDTSRIEQRKVLADALLRAHDAGVSVGLATHEHNVAFSGAADWVASVRFMLEGLDEARPGILSIIECVDLGGGYDAQCLDEMLWGEIGESLIQYLRDRLPRCASIVLEPGKSLVQAYGMVAASVIGRLSDTELCADTSMAELPWPMPDRPVYVWRADQWHALPPGHGTISGRSTAETDILATGVSLDSLRVGETLLFAEAGAYDWSMRNSFGAGKVLDTVATSLLSPAHSG